VTAALITGAGQVEFREFDASPPVPGAVTVDVSLCGICGTEIASFRTGHRHSPAVCGHEWTGIVTAVGAEVADRTEGERVVVSVAPPCGRCVECRAGLTDHCRVVNDMARGRDPLAPPHGGFARSITVAAQRVLPVHPALRDEEAAQVEPVTVAFHGIRRSRIVPGDTVVVQGAGPIGLLAMQLARAAGAGRVIVIEPSQTRRRLAVELSADLAVAPGDEAIDQVNAHTGGLGADVVIECAGVPSLLQTAVDLTRQGGTVMLLSYIAQPASIEAAKWMAKEVTVIGAVAFTHDDLRRAMALIADGRVRVMPLHTRTVCLDELPATLRDLATGAMEDVKVLVDPRRPRLARSYGWFGSRARR
jgi:(R,R)-butanediol dehydrogenase/meso-butanediol dehydrogenase/diacetyl reductase